MTEQPFRNPTGGQVDRTKPLRFTFDGAEYQGFAGDSLASALLANGVRLVGRSFKYHRRRGIFSAGVEEPNALVQLRDGDRSEPDLRATEVELFDGLIAESQNRWPSLNFDIGALNDLFAALIPAGFYYKTFMAPAKLWHSYEHWIRKAAGLGRAPDTPDPDRYDHRYAHCDVLVAGGGPAGLMAALTAGRAGARVIIADNQSDWGGSLLGRRVEIDGKPAADWVAGAVAELQSLPEVTLLERSTVTSYYDHNMLLVAERAADHLIEPAAHQVRQRLWQVRAKEVVLATGAIERPLTFDDNDRPGVMLASAAQTYANRYGVKAGGKAVVFTNNDFAYEAALNLKAAGVEIMAVIDARADVDAGLRERLKTAGIGLMAGHVVADVEGKEAVRAARVMAYDGESGALSGDVKVIDCDLIAVSGGWTPSVHLHSQAKGKIRYDETLSAFRPESASQRERSAGACNGSFGLDAALKEGADAGAEAARAAGFDSAAAGVVPAVETEAPLAPLPLWRVPSEPGGHGKAFVDLQNDVTADGVALAHREGYRSVEHLKRYTTLGMGTDQGRTSNVIGLALMAGLRDEAIPAVGTTTFRPPFTPVTLGTIAGEETGEHFAPTRRSAMHDWHAAKGAPFVPAGLWLRPQGYPGAGETIFDAMYREAKAVRERVGMVDVSTLGKIDIKGRDAAEFLNRVYINGFAKLPVGKVRYGVMLREDGLVYDDGTTTHIADNHYMMTTTTAKAVEVMRHLEYHAQVVWPALDVHLISVTEEWAAMALAGPHSRRVLEKLTGDIDVSNEACPFMAFREGTIAGAPGRLFRISFSGELAYEINVPADYGLDVWERVLAAGQEFGIVPYGTEAMNILRMEKGHIVGGELNGRASPGDLGFGGMLSKIKDFIGKSGLDRPALQADGRKQLVGLIPVDHKTKVPRGAQLVLDPAAPPPVDMQGEVTSNAYSPNLGHPIALGLLRDGRERHGETLHAHSPVTGETVAMFVTEPCFIDPKGERLRA